MTDVNGTVAAIRTGLESNLIVHDEQVVFQGDDEAHFTVIQANVSLGNVEDGNAAGLIDTKSELDEEAELDAESAESEANADLDVEGNRRVHPIFFAQVNGGQPGAVCIAVHDGRLLLARHWRIATDSFEWEFPRSMGAPGEVSGATAERELETEAGVKATSRRLLQMMYADTCKLRDSIAVVELAVDSESLDEAGVLADGSLAGLDDLDGVTLAWLTPEEIDTMIAEGNIMDGITLAAYLIWKTRREADEAVEGE